MRARVPASTSNIGPGFDVLGLALNLYIEVTVEPADSLTVTAEGEGSDLSLGAEHLAAKIAAEVMGHDRLKIHVASEIPLGRGLGSSAALAVATAAAAGAPDPLGVAAASDGHAENAAASVLGGLVAATMVEGAPVAWRLPLDEELCFVLVVPDRELATKTARGVLPERVRFSDAVTNLGRMGLLLAGLADRSALVAAAGVDRLHQDARAALFPEAPSILSALTAAGAVISCWSGAGPTMLGIATSTVRGATLVAEAGEEALVANGLSGRVHQLRADANGLVVRPR